MVPSVWVKATVLWFAILALAILNGAFREGVLLPAVGSFVGLVLSGIILSSLVLLVALVAVPWYRPMTSRQWCFVGLFWLGLTVLFEFGFGRFIQHNTWRELLEAYTFRGGNTWLLVLVATLVSPWVAAKLRGHIRFTSPSACSGLAPNGASR